MEARRRKLRRRERKRKAENGKGKKQDKKNTHKRLLIAKSPSARRRLHLQSSSDSDNAQEQSHSVESETQQPTSCDTTPAHFREDSDGDNGVLCEICHLTEQEGMADDTVFWVDCDVCGLWVHNYCAFTKNAVTRKFICKNCLKGQLSPL